MRKELFSIDMLLYMKYYIETETNTTFEIEQYVKRDDSFITSSKRFPVISREGLLFDMAAGAIIVNARDYNAQYMQTALMIQIERLAVKIVTGKIKPINEKCFPQNLVKE